MSFSSDDSIAIFMSGPVTQNGGMRGVRKDSNVTMLPAKKYPGSVEDAAKEFAVDVPPETVRAVVIMTEPETLPTNVKRIAPALQAAGFTNLVTMGVEAFDVAMPIEAAGIQFKVGDLMGVLSRPENLKYGAILQKTDDGYERVKVSLDFPSEMIQYPTLKHIILRGGVGDTLESQKTECRLLYPGKTHHFPSNDQWRSWQNYAWNRALGTTLVKETVSMELYFVCERIQVPILFQQAVLPASKTFRLDVAESKHLDVFVHYTSLHEPLSSKFELFKTFNFKTKKDRVLRVSLIINMHQAPSINVTTVGPVKVTAPPSTKVCIEFSALTSAYRIIDQNGATPEVGFPTLAETLADLQEKAPADTVGFIQYLFASERSLKDTVTCWQWLLDCGYTTCKHNFGTLESTCATFLFGYDVDVAEGECVAIWVTGKNHAILKRSGDSFRYLNFCVPRKALTMIRKYDVKTVIFCPSTDEECTLSDFGDRNVIVGIDEANENRYSDFHSQSVIAPGGLGKYTVQQIAVVKFKVSWGDTTMFFETGFVTLPFGWTSELDVGNAKKLNVVSLFHYGDSIKEERVFNLQEIGNSKVALTFAIERQLATKVSCAPLPPGLTPRPISFCVLIERTAIGFRKTIYFRDSDKTVIDNCTNLFAAFESFKLANHAAVIFNASGSTVAERDEWRQAAEEHEFQVIQFVNSPVLTLNSILFGRKFDEFDGNKTVLVTDMTAVDRKGQKSPLTYILQTSQKLKLKKITMAKIDKVYSSLESVDHVFVAVEDVLKPPILPAHLNAVFLQTTANSTSKYLFSRVDTVSVADFVMDDTASITFIAEWNDEVRTFNTEWQSVPFSRDIAFHVGKAKILKIEITQSDSKQRELLKAFSFKILYDRVVVLNISVDAMLVPSVKHVRSDHLPYIVLKFTTDNHVIVRSNVIDELEYPAYVSFVDDNVIVGEGALAQQQRHPDRVVYDIYRMLSTDFDPDHPDPSWAFKTTRGDGDNVIVHMGDSCSTAIVCFGVIVNAIKKKVEENTNHDLVFIGVKLPTGSSVSEDAKNGINGMIGATLVVFN